VRWPLGCPDKTCRKLARKPLVIGFMCVGRLSTPTGHVIPGVNDLCFCFKQRACLNRWHMNRADIGMLAKLLDKAMKNDAEDNREQSAIHLRDKAP